MDKKRKQKYYGKKERQPKHYKREQKQYYGKEGW